MRLVLTGGYGAVDSSNLGSLAFHKSGGWRNYECQNKARAGIEGGREVGCN